MSTPDVRVRLSAEGVKEVVDALKQVQKVADDASRKSRTGLVGFRSLLGDIKGLLPALGLTAAAGGILAIGRNALLAADNTGKLAEKVGATSEEISTLKFAAVTADLAIDTLQAGLVGLTRSLGELDKGTDKQVDAFARLGLSARDFAGKTTGQAFDIVAQKLGNLTNSTKRTQIANDIFGRQIGSDLIPLLKQLADDGFDATRKEAEEFGLLITGDLAAAADAAGDSFDIIKLQVQGLATSFISGLAPSIVDTMATFSKSLKGDGVEKMQEFGRETGRVLRVVIQTFRLFGTIVIGLLNTLGQSLGGFFAAIVQGAQGNFREAGAILRESFIDEFSNLGGVLKQAFVDFGRLVDEANRDPPEIKVKVRATADPRAIETTKDRKDREGDEKRIQAELDRALEDIARKEEAAGEARLRTQIELLELTGRERDARIRALDEELRKRREILAFAGQLTDQAREQLGRRRDVGVAQIDLEEATAKGELALQALRRARERIQQDVELGVISELTGRERITEIEKEQLVVLRQLAAAALAAANATGSPEAIANAEAFAAAVRQVEVSVASTTNSLLRFKLAGADAFQTGLADLLANAEDIRSLEDAFRSLANTVVQALQRIAAEILAAQIQKGLFNLFGGLFGASAAGGARGGEVVSKAAGGAVHGPGTATSDSIPAWLSDGEFVVRASAVHKYGADFLHALNAGRLQVQAIAPPRIPRFAEGGPVEFDAATKFDGRLQIGLSPGLAVERTDYTTPEGMRVLIQQAGKYRNAMRAALGV